MEDITVILVKTSWCPHCQHFTPIFDKASNLIKMNNDMKDKNVKFISYDMENPVEKNNFINDNPGLIEFLEGYPTVFLKIKNDKKIRTEYIDHTVIDNSIKDADKALNMASNNFINNIVNKYKTINSDNKDTYTSQKGGVCKLEDKYKKQYLELKSRYIEMKLNKFI